jgi:hypothetical protein
MSFLDTLKNLGLWQQPQAQQPNPYGLSPEMVSQARMQALGNIGGQLLAISQQMTPDQRARMMAGADWTGGMQSNLYNAAQMQLLSAAQKRRQAQDERDVQAQEYLASVLQNMPDGPQRQKAMIYFQMGDMARAAEAATSAGRTPDYQIDTETGQYIDKSNPAAGAQPIPGWQGKPADQPKPSDRLALYRQYEDAPETQSYNVLAGTLGSLSGAIDDNSKVSDLDFVYGVAKALDPTSVVRESEGQMVVQSQGLAPSLLGYINGLVGGGQLTREKRRELYALVERRAGEYRKQAETRRQNVLQLGGGILADEDLRPLLPLPEIAPLNIPQSPAPGRTDRLPEPELIGVN